MFALIQGDGFSLGQRVQVHVDGGTRRGVVVIAPEQMAEFHAPPPRARAQIDTTPIEPPSGEAADLLKSLDLPEDLLRA